MTDVRGLFSRLAWDTADEVSVLTPQELAVEPLKWLKYLILDRCGVESLEVIADQIHRYRLEQIDEARRWVTHRFQDARLETLQVVAKVVPWASGAQLRNYRMLGSDDVDRAFAMIVEDYGAAGHELWCCEALVEPGGFNLSGRLSFGEVTTLELVWYGSPRLIESLQLPAFPLPYVQASIRPAGLGLDVETLHVPPQYSHVDPMTWSSELSKTAQMLLTRRPSKWTISSSSSLPSERASRASASRSSREC